MVKCPMLAQALLSSHEKIINPDAGCMQSFCALWDSQNKQCSKLTAAVSLAIIAEQLQLIRQRQIIKAY